MEYPNLADAWQLLCEDNVPAQMRSMPQFAFSRVLGEMLVDLALGDVQAAEAELAELRCDGDMEDLDSPLWAAVSPVDDDSPLQPSGNAVMDYMFEAL